MVIVNLLPEPAEDEDGEWRIEDGGMPRKYLRHPHSAILDPRLLPARRLL
jgi:hypothetical protein